MQLLDDLPGIRAYGEIFLGVSAKDNSDVRMRPAMSYVDWIDQYGTEFPPFRVNRYLAHIEGGERVTFKLMYDQIRQRPETIVALAMRKYRLVHLVRRNYLDTIVSRSLAQQTGLYHSVTPVNLQTIHLPVPSLITQLHRLDWQVRLFSAALKLTPCSVLTVDYENLVDHTSGEMQRVAEFMGLTYSVARDDRRDWRKINTKTIDQVVENFDEIRIALSKTRFAYLLELEELSAIAQPG
jgi:hypothetical protein